LTTGLFIPQYWLGNGVTTPFAALHCKSPVSVRLFRARKAPGRPGAGEKALFDLNLARATRRRHEPLRGLLSNSQGGKPAHLGEVAEVALLRRQGPPW